LCIHPIKPSMESTRKFIVLKASAGSGKTFRLVFHYLSCALRFENPSYYKHILAITFTNAAANEMKQRVLKALKELSEGQGHADLEKKLLKELAISADVLKSRSQAAYSHMLHNYSKLSILTIDSFTHRMVRSFARDLQLNNDFNIEMKPEHLQEKTVDRMLEYIGQDALLTQYLHRYSKYLLEEGKPWNPREGLIEMAKVLFKEDGQEPLKKLESVDLPKIQEEYSSLHAQVRAFETEVKTLASEIVDLVTKAGITTEDIPSKSAGYISGLTTFIRSEVVRPFGKNILKALENHTWLSDKANAGLVAQLSPYRAELDTKADKLFDLMSNESLQKIKLMCKIKDNLYTMGLIDRMNEYAQEIRVEENMVLLADFHRMINSIIQGNDAPFIFERIGARYKHILVDEFQDTSKMQWMNLIPLIQNCLAEGHENLIVGDAKQSIYRWRSANVEQFTMLPEVPTSFNMSLAQKTFGENIFEDDLKTNFRSSESVIDFNNTIFPPLAAALPGCSEVYKGDPQIKNSKDAGFVRLVGDHLLKRGDAGYDTFVKDGVVHAIQDCKKSGFRYGDITILVRSHNDGNKCTTILNEHDIPYTTAENALLIHSIGVRVIMGYFEFSVYPKNKYAAFDMMQSLASVDSRVSLPDFISTYLSEKNSPPIDLNAFLSPLYGDMAHIMKGENVFHMAISLMRSLQLHIDSGVEYLLDLIKQHCIGKNIDLHRFIEWWKEHRNKQSSAAVNHPDAVNIMTIHKSKGLEFPAVIIPHFRETSKSSSIWIDVPKQICDLPTAYVTMSAKILSEADSESDEDLTKELSNENRLRFLDDINSMYVACTRAATRLYFIQEHGGTPFNKTLQDVLTTCFPIYAETGMVELGKQDDYTTQKASTTPTKTPRLTGKEMLYPKLRVLSAIKTDSPEITYGKLLHECLSLLKNANQTNEAIERVLQGRKDAQLHRTKLTTDIIKLTASTQTSTWFSDYEALHCERELISQQGFTLRPDRVVVLPDRVVVIDFKTGKQSEKHHGQVEVYKRELQHIYNKPVEGYLMYTEGPSIISV